MCTTREHIIASNRPRIPAHKLQELIHHNPNVKPQQAANQIIMNAIRDDASREELDELSFNLLDPKQSTLLLRDFIALTQTK